MAKKTKTKAFSFQGFDAQHYKTTEQYAAAVDALFDRATKAIADAAAKGIYNPDKPFSFDDYPSVKAYAQKIITGLANNITSVVADGSRKQWLFACQKNDEFVNSIIDTSKVSKARLNKMQDRNLDAMKTFQGRKVDGMNLSERVWKYTQQFKAQIELGLDVGLGEGRSAQQLSRDLRQNLQDPDRLFRRVRDKRGNMQLSKAAKAFHPGIGVYRSSAKNAARLTRSEINMAYREADWMRWQQLDFVVGFEVHRSNREPQFKCALCDKLVGRYPKTFKFKGWHPQCMCYATAILMDENDFDAQELSDLKSALRGTEYKKLEVKNEVTDMPDGFKEWVAENQQKQSNWGSTPYFIKDNFKGGLLSKGLTFATKDVPKVEPKVQVVPIVPQPTPTPKPEIKEPENIIDQNVININEVESILNVACKDAMTFEDANELKGNINYSKGGGYRINCQSCVVSNELRRRGFDVTALENTRQKNNIPYRLSLKTELAWIDKETGITPVKQKAGGISGVDNYGRIKSKTIKQLSAELSDLVKETGRYHIDFAWKGTRSGHIICLEKLSNGKVRFYDPQNGKLVSWADLSKRISLKHGVNVLRVDNLMINKDLINGIVVKL